MPCTKNIITPLPRGGLIYERGFIKAAVSSGVLLTRAEKTVPAFQEYISHNSNYFFQLG